jgi:hypothetical protein
MFKKFTTAFTASAIAVLGLVSIVGASTGDSFDVAGLDQAQAAPTAAKYVNFTIAAGDPNEEGNTGQVKVQPVGLSAEVDETREAGDYTNFTIANGDPNEEGNTGNTKVRPAVTEVSIDVSRQPGDYTNFTIANGDPNEEG